MGSDSVGPHPVGTPIFSDVGIWGDRCRIWDTKLLASGEVTEFGIACYATSRADIAAYGANSRFPDFPYYTAYSVWP